MITTVTEFPGLVCFSGQWQAGASFGDTVYLLSHGCGVPLWPLP